MLKKGNENGNNGVSPLLLSVGNMLGPVHCRFNVPLLFVAIVVPQVPF